MFNSSNGRLFDPEMREMDRVIWKIALPCALENLLTFAAGLIVAAMIGRLTADEIAAQAMGMRITGFLQSLFKGIGIGATVIIGVFYGMEKLGKCRRVAEQMMLVVLPISLLLTAIVICEPRPFLRLFADDEQLVELAVPYIRIAIWLVPSVAVSRIVTAAFNAQGDTRTPMIIAVTMNFISAGLGYLMIFVLGWGLLGAAWSLTLAYLAGMVMGLFALYWKKGLYFGVPRDMGILQWDIASIKDTFTTGLPASCENMMWSVVAIIMSRALLSYGTSVYSGYQLASQVEEFMGAPCFGFQTATTALIAQSLGRRDMKEAKSVHKRISFWGILVSLPIAVILFFGADFFMMLLTDKSDIQSSGAMYLMIAAIAWIPQTLNMIDFGAIRVTSSKSFPLIGTILGMWGVRVPVAVLAALVWKLDVAVVFAGIAFDQIFRWGLALVYRKKKNIFAELPVEE